MSLDLLKNALSIQEKKISTLGVLLVICTFYTLFCHYNDKEIINLVPIIQGFLAAFVGVNLISYADDYMNYRNKIKDVSNSE